MAKGNYISKAAENVQNFIGEKEVKKEKKAGRPSNGETVKISLAVPAELHAGMEAGAALFFKGNKTAYINSLIKKIVGIGAFLRMGLPVLNGLHYLFKNL